MWPDEGIQKRLAAIGQRKPAQLEIHLLETGMDADRRYRETERFAAVVLLRRE